MNVLGVIALTVPFVFIVIIEWLRIKERRKLYELRDDRTKQKWTVIIERIWYANRINSTRND